MLIQRYYSKSTSGQGVEQVKGEYTYRAGGG